MKEREFAFKLHESDGNFIERERDMVTETKIERGKFRLSYYQVGHRDVILQLPNILYRLQMFIRWIKVVNIT